MTAKRKATGSSAGVSPAPDHAEALAIARRFGLAQVWYDSATGAYHFDPAYAQRHPHLSLITKTNSARTYPQR